MRSDPAQRVLRGLRKAVPPPELRMRLRVLASRERQRRLNQRYPWPFMDSIHSHIATFFDEVVRVFALPAAGGVCSAVLLFVLFVVPAWPLRVVQASSDIPTVLTTEGSLISMGPFGPSDSDLVVDVSVDEQGRMMDYRIVTGTIAPANAEIRRRLENALLVSRFAPATAFGQPMPSKVRLWLRSSRIDVKG